MSGSESGSVTPVELFALVATCEKHKNPGGVLLTRAKDLRWSLLAMIASCFPDVSPLSCMIVWLEITAARLFPLELFFMWLQSIAFMLILQIFSGRLQPSRL